MEDLEYQLREYKPFVAKGISYHDRLNAVGIDNIIQLMGVGHPLSTRTKSKEQGILNQLNVPEHAFWAWVLKLPQKDQEELEFVSRVCYNKKKNELIDKTIETTDQFDDLIESVHNEDLSTEEAKDVATILDKKQNAATRALNQLTKIDELERGAAKGPGASEVMEIHVHTDDNTKSRLMKLQKQREK